MRLVAATARTGFRIRRQRNAVPRLPGVSSRADAEPSQPGRGRAEPRRTIGALARVVLLAGAVAVALWLAANLRSLDRADEASKLMARAVTGAAPPAGVDRARRLFEQARRFGPDAQLKVNEAGILVVAQDERAAELLREAVRREPEHVEAWVLIYSLSGGRRDPPGARARSRVLALDPRAGKLLDRIDASR